jgi:hypothetical protein
VEFLSDGRGAVAVPRRRRGLPPGLLQHLGQVVAGHPDETRALPKGAIERRLSRRDIPLRDFACRACGHEANADVNAVVNILAAGLAVTARGGTSRSKGPGEARTRPTAA